MLPVRILTQVVITGGQIFVRALAEAYRVAAQNQRQAGVRMNLDEARKILNFGDTKDPLSNYQKLLDSNDPAKGGSFYLQSKIYRAKERIELEQRHNDDDKTH